MRCSMNMFRFNLVLLVAVGVWTLACRVEAQEVGTAAVARQGIEDVIIDTDVGDDIDDAFALALALKSPELNILQINSDFGIVSIRTAMLQRFLDEIGRSDIPVATGVVS